MKATTNNISSIPETAKRTAASYLPTSACPNPVYPLYRDDRIE